MYLTAHRIRLKNRRTGVNAFLNVHGADRPWPTDPLTVLGLPETDPGRLHDRLLALPTRGGNPLISYLDLLAPDGTPRSGIIELIDLLAAADPKIHGGLLAIVRMPLAARLSLPSWRLSHWREELENLANPAEDLLRRLQW